MKMDIISIIKSYLSNIDVYYFQKTCVAVYHAPTTKKEMQLRMFGLWPCIKPTIPSYRKTLENLLGAHFYEGFHYYITCFLSKSDILTLFEDCCYSIDNESIVDVYIQVICQYDITIEEIRKTKLFFIYKYLSKYERIDVMKTLLEKNKLSKDILLHECIYYYNNIDFIIKVIESFDLYHDVDYKFFISNMSRENKKEISDTQFILFLKKFQIRWNCCSNVFIDNLCKFDRIEVLKYFFDDDNINKNEILHTKNSWMSPFFIILFHKHFTIASCLIEKFNITFEEITKNHQFTGYYSFYDITNAIEVKHFLEDYYHKPIIDLSTIILRAIKYEPNDNTRMKKLELLHKIIYD